MTSAPDPVAAIAAGDRRALARAITLVESQRAEDGERRERLLEQLLPLSGKAVRVGITGAPGVGKSTFIETIGLRLCDAGRKVAVLAVDPSSAVTGGSILGDKTRMHGLSRHPNAFIRPSPGGATLGGVALRTREAMLVCEAAGFDTVLVETIGTGQSEVAVSGMVDHFLLLLSPAAGDELQGIKRGVMELADSILVHKADGDLLPAAQRAAQQCLLALRILHSGEADVPVVACGSSTSGEGLDEFWSALERRVEQRRTSGAFAERRSRQAAAWFDDAVEKQLLADFAADAEAQRERAAARDDVVAGRRWPAAAAREVVARHRQRSRP